MSLPNWSVEEVIDWLINNDVAGALDYFFANQIDGNKFLNINVEEVFPLEEDAAKVNALLEPYRSSQQARAEKIIKPDHTLSSVRLLRSQRSIFSGGCGYCKVGQTTHFAGYSDQLRPADFEDLLNRGWTRSGTLLYQTINSNTCCAHYCIRIPVHQFQPSRAQKRVKKHVEDYLERGIERGSGANEDKPMTVEKSPMLVQEEITTVLQSIITAALERSELSVTVSELDTGITVRWSGKGNQTPQLMTPVAMKIEKLTRPSDAELSKQEIQTRVKQLAQQIALQCRLDGTGVTSVSVFEPGFVKFHLNDELTKRLIEEHSKLSSSQEVKAPKKNNNVEVAVEKKHQLEVTKHKPHLTDEVFNVYREFQVHIHGDKYEEVTEKGMTEFLIDTPLMYETSEQGVECGSYHMHWRLDGELIAVAVLDILPHSVNSVYFFWNPKYRNHAFGIYSALKEIEYCKTLPGVEYYFLGWYIHTCSKMNYKRKFKPCYILCPDTYVYVPYQEARPLMDEFGYTQLAVNAQRPPEPDPTEINHVLVQYFGDIFKFEDARLFLEEDHILRYQERLYEFVRSVGPEMSKRIVILLN